MSSQDTSKTKKAPKAPAGGKPEPTEELAAQPPGADAAPAEQSAAEQNDEHNHAHGHEHGHDHGQAHSHTPRMNEACKRELAIEIPANVVEKRVDELVAKYQKLARIPGFRPGKVPAAIIRKRYMGDIRNEVLEAVVPEYFQTEVRKNNYLPVSQPHVTDLEFEPNAPLKFKAAFEVLPDIAVSGYKGLKAEKKDISVSDAEIEDALKNLQSRQASYDAVEDRELTEGDFALVSFKGTAKGTKAIADKKAELAAKPAEGAAAQAAVQSAVEQSIEDEANKPVEVNDALVEIGSTNTVKEFSENLRGAKPGDTRSFDVLYPDDFNDQRLAGQVMHYEVEIKGVKKKVVPEINDEFAKELGDFNTLDELRARLRENMEAERKHELQHSEKEKLIDQLVEKNNFEVPQALIDRQIDQRLERGFRALAAQGMKMDDLKKMNFERLREAQKDAAVREVKASLLLDKVAEMENLDAADEDINKELESLAMQTKQPVDVLKKRMTQEGTLDRLKDRIRNEKALELLYSESA